jgi:hypothetical protein
VLPRLQRVVVLGIILALLGAGCGSARKLGATALSQRSKSLRSEAAEGALLAQDAAAGKTTRIYTRQHASDLHEAAARDAASLKAAETKAASEPELRELRTLATRVAADLEGLGAASRDEQRRLGRELQAAAEESRRIGKGRG